MAEIESEFVKGDLRTSAQVLEELLPKLMRILYRPEDSDLLRDLPVAQLRLMRLLYPDAKSHSSVGEELGISVSAITQVANRLEILGLVERQENATDRRIKNLKLTEK